MLIYQASAGPRWVKSIQYRHNYNDEAVMSIEDFFDEKKSAEIKLAITKEFTLAEKTRRPFRITMDAHSGQDQIGQDTFSDYSASAYCDKIEKLFTDSQKKQPIVIDIVSCETGLETPGKEGWATHVAKELKKRGFTQLALNSFSNFSTKDIVAMRVGVSTDLEKKYDAIVFLYESKIVEDAEIYKELRDNEKKEIIEIHKGEQIFSKSLENFLEGYARFQKEIEKITIKLEIPDFRAALDKKLESGFSQDQMMHKKILSAAREKAQQQTEYLIRKLDPKFNEYLSDDIKLVPHSKEKAQSYRAKKKEMTTLLTTLKGNSHPDIKQIQKELNICFDLFDSRYVKDNLKEFRPSEYKKKVDSAIIKIETLTKEMKKSGGTLEGNPAKMHELEEALRERRFYSILYNALESSTTVLLDDAIKFIDSSSEKLKKIALPQASEVKTKPVPSTPSVEASPSRPPSRPISGQQPTVSAISSLPTGIPKPVTVDVKVSSTTQSLFVNDPIDILSKVSGLFNEKDAVGKAYFGVFSLKNYADNIEPGFFILAKTLQKPESVRDMIKSFCEQGESYLIKKETKLYLDKYFSSKSDQAKLNSLAKSLHEEYKSFKATRKPT